MAEVLKRWNGSAWIAVANVNRIELQGGLAEPMIVDVYNIDLCSTESYIEFDKPLTMEAIQEVLGAFVITYNLSDSNAGYFDISAIEVIDAYTIKITHTNVEFIDDSRLTVGYNDERGTLIGTNGYKALGMFKTATMSYPFIGIRLKETITLQTLALDPVINDTLSSVALDDPIEGGAINESITLTNLTMNIISIDDSSFTTILE